MRIKIFISAIMFILLMSCATDYKRGPEGGPGDKKGPAVGSASIQNGSLNMDKNSWVEIEFSEFIDVNSAKNSVAISPRSASKKAKTYWYDKSVEIKFRDIEADQTVVITVNPSLKDTQGNPMSEPYSLSFSTGGNIDKNYISGRVNGTVSFDQIEAVNSSKVKVNLYSAETDSAGFTRTDPEYSAGLSKDGLFEFKNIGSGKFRLLAFNDMNNDSKPQTETEMIGFIPDLIELSDNDSINFGLALGYYDNVLPFIKNTSAPENNILKIEFSEKLKIKPGYIDSCFVNGKAVEFKEYASKPDIKTIYLEIPQLRKQDEIRFVTGKIEDKSGNFINEALRVKKHAVKDSIQSPAFNFTGKLPEKIESDKTISISTSRFMNDSLRFQIRNKDSLIQSVDKGIEIIPYLVKIDLKMNGIKPDSYDFMITRSDSLIITSKLKVEEPAGTGSVSGKISGREPGKFILICKNLKGGSENFEIRSKDYKTELVPGKYMLALFTDDNDDGVYSADLKNFISEKAVFTDDTVFVRKNWETTDVNFEFK